MSDLVKLQESAWYADTVGHTVTDDRWAANAGMEIGVERDLRRVVVEGVVMGVGPDRENG